MTPVLPEFAVMKPAQQMRVVIQSVGSPQHLLKVMTAIARRSFFLSPLTDDAQFLPAQLGNFGQNLFQIHRFPFPGHPAAFLRIRLAEQRCPAQDHVLRDGPSDRVED
jgi:hypothetical protein